MHFLIFFALQRPLITKESVIWCVSVEMDSVRVDNFLLFELQIMFFSPGFEDLRVCI